MVRTNEVVRANDTSGGETLVAVQEEGNPWDRYNVATVKVRWVVSPKEVNPGDLVLYCLDLDLPTCT